MRRDPHREVVWNGPPQPPRPWQRQIRPPRSEPGVALGLVVVVLALALAIAGDLSTCQPLEYGRDGMPTGPRECR